MGHSKSFEMLPLKRLGMVSLFTFRSNYGSILYHLRDEARHWSKIAIFSYSLHSTVHRCERVRVSILPYDLV